MLKHISNLGKTLNKTEQKNVIGGAGVNNGCVNGQFFCETQSDCDNCANDLAFSVAIFRCVENLCIN